MLLVDEKVSEIFSEDIDCAVDVWLKVFDAKLAVVRSTRSVNPAEDRAVRAAWTWSVSVVFREADASTPTVARPPALTPEPSTPCPGVPTDPSTKASAAARATACLAVDSE